MEAYLQAKRPANPTTWFRPTNMRKLDSSARDGEQTSPRDPFRAIRKDTLGKGIVSETSLPKSDRFTSEEGRRELSARQRGASYRKESTPNSDLPRPDTHDSTPKLAVGPDAYKAAGNVFYKARNYERAIEEYTKGTSLSCTAI
jgi:hypothetical protein